MEFSLVNDRVHVREMDTVDSTNNELHRLIESGTAVGWTTVIAGQQTAGRGRQGRTWQSDPGAGIWTSVLIDLEDCPEPSWLSLIAGLAIVRGVSKCGFVGAQLKWPNDVIAQGRKLAGILSEGVVGNPTYIVGMGINVFTDVYPGAIGLAELPRSAGDESPCDPRLVFESVIRELVALIDSWQRASWDTGAIHSEYLVNCRSIGADLGITEPDGLTWTGTGVGVDSAGHLLVQETGSTRIRTVIAADVVHATIEPCTPKSS
jgi:BirA family transcriptional regulator, biotin operon repressor / biotin---[acetyl-CoA-carboxylase] ligase